MIENELLTNEVVTNELAEGVAENVAKNSGIELGLVGTTALLAFAGIGIYNVGKFIFKKTKGLIDKSKAKKLEKAKSATEDEFSVPVVKEDRFDEKND